MFDFYIFVLFINLITYAMFLRIFSYDKMFVLPFKESKKDDLFLHLLHVILVFSTFDKTVTCCLLCTYKKPITIKKYLFNCLSFLKKQDVLYTEPQQMLKKT